MSTKLFFHYLFFKIYFGSFLNPWRVDNRLLLSVNWELGGGQGGWGEENMISPVWDSTLFQQHAWGAKFINLYLFSNWDEFGLRCGRCLGSWSSNLVFSSWNVYKDFSIYCLVIDSFRLGNITSIIHQNELTRHEIWICQDICEHYLRTESNLHYFGTKQM